MTYKLETFNQLTKKKAATELFKCCGSNRWVERLMKRFPFKDEMVLWKQAGKIWYEECEREDFLEAFKQHPRIGDVENLKKKFAATAHWSDGEQTGVKAAAEQTIRELARLNEVYFKKFGYIFIVCATGKSASEMLQLLKIRANHQLEEELEVAMGEQHKITLIRLKKLLELHHPKWEAASQITTHVLDTSIGRPGKGIGIKLKKAANGDWRTIAIGITDKDGRIADLLANGRALPPGDYLLRFDTKTYFQQQKTQGFYPEVFIHFTTFDQTHYHVPLLINPFGYSTYRGS